MFPSHDQLECYRLIIHGKEHLSYIQKYGCNPDKYYRYLECGQELRDYCMCEKCFKSKLKDKCSDEEVEAVLKLKGHN